LVNCTNTNNNLLQDKTTAALCDMLTKMRSENIIATRSRKEGTVMDGAPPSAVQHTNCLLASLLLTLLLLVVVKRYSGLAWDADMITDLFIIITCCDKHGCLMTHLAEREPVGRSMKPQIIQQRYVQYLHATDWHSAILDSIAASTLNMCQPARLSVCSLATDIYARFSRPTVLLAALLVRRMQLWWLTSSEAAISSAAAAAVWWAAELCNYSHDDGRVQRQCWAGGRW